MYEFFDLLQTNKVNTYLLAGNHCTISKGVSTFHYLKESFPEYVEFVEGDFELLLPTENYAIHFQNHCDLGNKLFPRAFCSNILITHFRCTVNSFIKEEIDTEKFLTPFDLVLAGDIHCDFEKDNLVYVNQPINSKFETKSDCGFVLLACARDYKPNWKRIKTYLPSLIQVNCTVQEFPAMLNQLNSIDFYRVDVTGSLKELRGIKTGLPNVLLQKIPILEDSLAETVEIPKIESLPLDAQLVEYLKLLNYPEEKVEELLNVWKET